MQKQPEGKVSLGQLLKQAQLQWNFNTGGWQCHLRTNSWQRCEVV